MSVHIDQSPKLRHSQQKHFTTFVSSSVSSCYNNNNNKEAVNKLKYKSLCIEIQRMWNLTCTIVPVIIGATGIVTRSLRKNLETVPGKHSIDSLQKTAILGTSHVIPKVLQCEV